jgi:NTE family protein
MSDIPDRSIKRVLVLSGGGGRGAYQVGVCQVLAEMGWEPDMVVGNSIGSTNGAIFIAPAQYSGAKQLEIAWSTDILNDHLHAVTASEAWSPLARNILAAAIPLLRTLEEPAARSLVDKPWAKLSRAIRGELPESESERSLLDPIEWLLSRIREGLEQGLARPPIMQREGWRKALQKHVDFERISAPDAPYFGVAATDVATGDLHMFWNRVPRGVKGGASQVNPGQLIDSVLASSSIPGIYDSVELNGRYWWDGALMANTPIAPVIDIGVDTIEEIIVVLMTPWVEAAQSQGLAMDGQGPAIHGNTPTVLDALERFIDWMMLAPLRSELRHLDEEQRKKVKIIAPKKLQGVIQMIDYDRDEIEALIAQGKQDAEKMLISLNLS